MQWFKLGFYSGIICCFLWICFDQFCLNNWSITKSCNTWLKQSFRKSIILNIGITTGTIIILSKALDMLNALAGTFTMLFLISIYNSSIVIKNKTKEII